MKFPSGLKYVVIHPFDLACFFTQKKKKIHRTTRRTEYSWWLMLPFSRLLFTEEKKQSRGDQKKAGKWLQKSLAFVLSEENKENVTRNQARSVLVALLFVGVQCACLNKTSITLSNIFFAFVIWRKKKYKNTHNVFFLVNIKHWWRNTIFCESTL